VQNNKLLIIANWFVLVGTMLPSAGVTWGNHPMFMQGWNFVTVMFLLGSLSLAIALVVPLMLIQNLESKHDKHPTAKHSKGQPISAKILHFPK